MKKLSIRARIILLVVLAAMPTLAVTIYGSWDERVRAIAGARNSMQSLAKLAAQQQEQIIEGSKQALVAISLMPAALRNDRAGCNAYLATLLEKSAGLYHSIGIYDADAVMQCNAIPWRGRIQSADRLYIRLARETRRFAVGEYQVGRVTKLPGINLGYPMLDAQGGVTGVAFIALDLASLNRVAATVPLPDQGVLTVVDRDGIVLARYPPIEGRVGEKLQVPQILKQVLSGPRGNFEAKGSGGIERLVAYDTVAENPDGGIPIRVVVSVPLGVVLAEANHARIRDIGAVLVATVLLLIGAWFGADIFVLDSIRKLIGVAKHVQAGRLGARTGLAHGNDELAQLGAAFDNMASALQTRDTELRHALQEVQEQAITDPLSGLYNRRFLFDVLPRELTRALRKNLPVAVMMIDIDHFKRVNDTYGHEAGDITIRAVAQSIKGALRGSDYTCRYGGEEIAAVLPESPVAGALVRAEAMRAAVQALDIVCADGRRIKVTVSIGVAVAPASASKADELLRVADEALYMAKGGGRNQVVVHGAGNAPDEPVPA